MEYLRLILNDSYNQKLQPKIAESLTVKYKYEIKETLTQHATVTVNGS